MKNLINIILGGFIGLLLGYMGYGVGDLEFWLMIALVVGLTINTMREAYEIRR